VGTLSSLGLARLLDITHVLSAVNFRVEKDLGDICTLHVPLRDSEDENLLRYLPEAIKFIHDALEGQPPGRVLVHCQGGVSRSVSVVAAYLMKTRHMEAHEVGEGCSWASFTAPH
jgi:protein-tyrosine phosphatase